MVCIINLCVADPDQGGSDEHEHIVLPSRDFYDSVTCMTSIAPIGEVMNSQHP